MARVLNQVDLDKLLALAGNSEICPGVFVRDLIETANSRQKEGVVNFLQSFRYAVSLRNRQESGTVVLLVNAPYENVARRIAQEQTRGTVWEVYNVCGVVFEVPKSVATN